MWSTKSVDRNIESARVGDSTMNEVEGVGQKLVRAHPRLMVVDDGHQHHFVDVQHARDIDQRVADVRRASR